MANKIEVEKLIVNERDVNVYVENPELLINKQIQPEGRLLADSERLSFIYILDVENDFIYISFPDTVWEELNTAFNKCLPLYLNINKDERVQLIQFQEELEYLLSNIQENSNYGQKMVQAVSNAFLRKG
jgi:hypothetical protein